MRRRRKEALPGRKLKAPNNEPASANCLPSRQCSAMVDAATAASLNYWVPIICFAFVLWRWRNNQALRAAATREQAEREE